MLVAVVVDVLFGDRELLIRHVHARDRTPLPDERGEDKTVLACTATEVEDVQSVQEIGRDQTATVVSRRDVRVDAGKQRLELVRDATDGAAGVGLEIGRGLEFLAVVVLNSLSHHLVGWLGTISLDRDGDRNGACLAGCSLRLQSYGR